MVASPTRLLAFAFILFAAPLAAFAHDGGDKNNHGNKGNHYAYGHDKDHCTCKSHGKGHEKGKGKGHEHHDHCVDGGGTPVPVAGTSVKFDLTDPVGSIFPSNRYTVADTTQNTRVRVNLPKPNCTVRPSDCADVDLLNTLDGFSSQPRITIPFTADINYYSVNSDTVFLYSLGDTLGGGSVGETIGITQIVWDPETKTLAFKPISQLREHTRYMVVVTDGVTDAATGAALVPGAFTSVFGKARGPDSLEYLTDLRAAIAAGANTRYNLVAASLFTTQSITADLVKIKRSIKSSTPAKANFLVGSSNGVAVRAVFPMSTITGMDFARQVTTAPGFQTAPLPLPALNVVPGAVGQIAYGKFVSPNYETAGKYIPATGTLTGQPQKQSDSELMFQLFVPAGAKPAGGWPVVIFGHGFTDSMYGAPWTVASVFASRGIATLSINAVGHGGGAAGVINVTVNGTSVVTVKAGGRGIDQDGNTVIDTIEGLNAAAPRTAVGNRDGLRQTVIDLMQLVRQVEVGVDIDGDGSADLNAARIYYAGQSLGGIYGTTLLAVEPNIKAGVPNVAGGSIVDVSRLGAFRPLLGYALATRTPSLINVTDPSGIAFNENLPARLQLPLYNNVPGAMAIQQALDRFEWLQQSGNPVAWAEFIRKRPLAGNTAKPVLFQFATGDQVVPNTTSHAILRAGSLAANATLYRHDLARAANPSLPLNPHTFLTNINMPAAAPFAVGAQTQMAVFFQSGGATVIDPDGPGAIFETPMLEILE
jgi:hypothetical protein